MPLTGYGTKTHRVTMRKYHTNANVIRVIKICMTVQSDKGVYLNNNIFLERIMSEALHDHEGSARIGGRLITNFRFADYIVLNAEEEKEADVLVDRLDTTTTRYKMGIGPDKTTLMTNTPNGFQ